MPTRLTQLQFIEKSTRVHGDVYDYSCVEYHNNTKKVKIICGIHGEFMQSPKMHMCGQGCPQCGGKLTTTLISFVDKARLIHGGTYDYSHVVYVRTHDVVQIDCKIHGPFMQSPLNHLQGSGCPKCMRGRDPNTTISFIERANIVHGNMYDYSKTNYTSVHRKVEIICCIHGIFKQTPNVHLKGCGCPHCTTSVSHKETNWLTHMGVPNTPESRQVCILANNIRYKVDGYIPETNTVYEFWGDFWHGNPTIYNQTDINVVTHKTFGEMYKNTQSKRQDILNAEYNLVETWEHEWDDIPNTQETNK